VSAAAQPQDAGLEASIAKGDIFHASAPSALHVFSVLWQTSGSMCNIQSQNSALRLGSIAPFAFVRLAIIYLRIFAHSTLACGSMVLIFIVGHFFAPQDEKMTHKE
jgi:hypothetical protein